MKRVVVIVSALAAIAGCRETQHCNEGFSYQSGSCMARVDVDASGSDTAVDAGNDGGSDAGPCNGGCGTSEVCLTHQVDGSTTDAGALNACVACVGDGDCAAIRATDGGGGDAGASNGRAICENFQCILGCRASTDCVTNVCRPDHRCSVYPANNDVCFACDTDRDCQTGRCVAFDNAAHPGSFCLSTVMELGTCSARHRFTQQITQVTTVDGAPLDDYCIPNNVACEAVTAFENACSTATMPCPPTGQCGSSSTCTYGCDPMHGSLDCPGSHICPSGSGSCL